VLDAVDAVLVRELQRDGRATFQALADRVGLSRTAVRTRVQHLLDSGIVRVVGIVHASVIGTGAIGHLFVDVDGPARHVVDAVARKPATWFAALSTGAHAVVAEVRVRDDVKLAEEVDAVRSLPGVRGVEVFRVISVVKDAHSVVTELPDVSLDDIDWRLLRELTRDGRTPYTRLAEVVGLSQAATRARAVRLMRSGVIHVSGIVDSRALGSGELAGVGVRVSSDVDAAVVRIARLSGINYVVSGFGRYDLVCGIDATSRDLLLSTLEAVRAVPGVWVGESWHHLDVVKQTYGADLD
jgi:DNA-binding Lrp family transcriptional regulator